MYLLTLLDKCLHSRKRMLSFTSILILIIILIGLTEMNWHI